MAAGYSVTKKQYEQVMMLHSKAPDLKVSELSELIGLSETTISRILNGSYDEKFNPKSQEKPQSVDVSFSILTEELRTFRELFMQMEDTKLEELLKVEKANNALLADIATMLVNHVECCTHQPSKSSEKHFRDRIAANRIDKVRRSN